MIEGWEKYEFSDCIVDNKIGRSNQINASEIKEVGRFPVIDQGQDFIAGFSNEEEKLVSDGLPYVIFGDHTRSLKFVDFPFIVGADGTKVLSPNLELFDPKFFYFQLLSFDIPSRGYNRHYKLLKEKVVHRPELSEQRKIAYVLSTVQKSIEQQDKLIKTTTELKKALMQKLFTEGLSEFRRKAGTKGEKQKQTEIGLVPESWEVVELGDVCEKTKGGGTPSTKNPDYWFGDIFWTTSKWLSKDKIYLVDGEKKISQQGLENSSSNLLPVNNLLVSTRVVIGKASVNKIPIAFSQDLTGLWLKQKIINPLFLAYQIQSERVNNYLQSLKRGATIQGITRDDLRKTIIVLPSIKEQDQVAKTLELAGRKIELLQKKKSTLTALFKTLLHELMTGQRRVHEIAFRAEGIEALEMLEAPIKEYELKEQPLSLVAEGKVHGYTNRT